MSSFPRETSTHFINYTFKISNDEKTKFYKNIVDKSYRSEKLDEHMELQKQITKQWLSTTKIIDIPKIEALETSIYKNTIFYRNHEESIYIMVNNIQVIKNLSAKEKVFVIQLKKWNINYNPDYFDTLLWESLESEKATHYIDDISQELILTINYELDKTTKECVCYWTISFINDIDFKLRKEYISFIMHSFFEKYSWNKWINMSYYDYAYSSDKLKNLVKNTDKLLYIKYKEMPEGMSQKSFSGKFPDEVSEEELYADLMITKKQIPFYRNKKSLWSFLDDLSELKDLRIKTSSGLIKNEKLRHSMDFTFEVDSKMKFIDPKQKEGYRENVYKKISQQIKPNPSL